MKNTILVFAVLLSFFSSFANTYQTIEDGFWNAPTTWEGGVVPPSTLTNHEIVQIDHIVEKNGDLMLLDMAGLRINTDGMLLIEHNLILQDSSTVVVNGSLEGFSLYLHQASQLNVKFGLVNLHGNLVAKDQTVLSFTSSTFSVGLHFELYQESKVYFNLTEGLINGDFKGIGPVGINLEETTIQITGNYHSFGATINLDGNSTLESTNKTFSKNTQIEGVRPGILQDVGLPVELSVFESKILDEGIFHYWKTVPEQHNEYFELEYSTDGLDWEVVKRLAGAGATAQANEYKFVDNQPSEDIVYTRLKQVDYDGTATYSNINRVGGEESPLQINTYPNPVTNQLTVSGVDEISRSSIKWFNSNGVEVTPVGEANPNGVTYYFDNTRLSAGPYFLVVQTKGKLFTKTILVQH